MYFSIFHIFNIILLLSSLGKESFTWVILNSLQPTMFCAKFAWNWSSGSGEVDKNVKRLQVDRQKPTDHTQQAIGKVHFNSQLNKASLGEVF